MAQNDFALFQIYSNKLKMFLDLPNHIASANMSYIQNHLLHQNIDVQLQHFRYCKISFALLVPVLHNHI